jgi:hypothetical protein
MPLCFSPKPYFRAQQETHLQGAIRLHSSKMNLMSRIADCINPKK